MIIIFAFCCLVVLTKAHHSVSLVFVYRAPLAFCVYFRFLFFIKRERLHLNEPPFSFSIVRAYANAHSSCGNAFRVMCVCVNHHHRPYPPLATVRASDMMNSFSFRQAIMVYYVPFNGFCRCYTCQHNRRRLLYSTQPFFFALHSSFGLGLFSFLSPAPIRYSRFAFSFSISVCRCEQMSCANYQRLTFIY